MKAVPGATAPAPRPLGQKVFHFDEAIEVPAVRDDEMLLARFVLGDSWVGAVRAALYKQPPVSITLRDRSGAPLGERRLVPVMAASLSSFLRWWRRPWTCSTFTDTAPAARSARLS